MKAMATADTRLLVDESRLRPIAHRTLGHRLALQQLRRAGCLRRCDCHPIALDTHLDTVKVLPHEQLLLLDQARVQRRGAPVATFSRHEDVRRHLIAPNSPRPLLLESRVLVRLHSLHRANNVSCVQDVTCQNDLLAAGVEYPNHLDHSRGQQALLQLQIVASSCVMLSHMLQPPPGTAAAVSCLIRGYGAREPFGMIGGMVAVNPVTIP